MATVDRKALLEAVEKRNKALRDKTPSQVLYMPHDEEHRDRQDFRRRVDYIMVANKPVQAFESLKVCGSTNDIGALKIHEFIRAGCPSDLP